MNKPHVHAELIKKWADGAEIQFSHDDGKVWADVSEPNWTRTLHYRVKPKPDYSKFAGLYEDSGWHTLGGVYSCNLVLPSAETRHDDTYKLVNKLELVFDGETKQLKQVVIRDKAWV